MQDNSEVSNSVPRETPLFATAEEYFDASEKLASEARFEEAVEILRRATHQFPDSAAATYNLGVALILKIREDNAHAELWENNADVNYETQEALEALRSAVALQPDMVPAYNNLARLHALRGDAEEAIAAWRKSLEIDEFQPIVREELEVYKNKIGVSPEAASDKGIVSDGTDGQNPESRL